MTVLDDRIEVDYDEDYIDVGEGASGAPVLDMLTEGEACFYAIMTDPSGLDAAEFLWTDERQKDGCWRAWPFQWPWWRTRAPKQIDQCARSIGKSESIMARTCAFPFNHPGQEMVLTAPEGIHVDAITDRIEAVVLGVRFYREMVNGGRLGITHRPFKIKWANGTLIHSRLPQKSGVGLKGTHPVCLEMDEGQDFPEKGWVEIIETVNRAVEGSEWRVHGVTKGVRDRFYEYTQDSPDNDWVVHRITALNRPNWTEEEREQKLKEYGGSSRNPDFRRNVYGAHGDATNPIFNLTRFMHVCDQVEGSTYNTDEYYVRHISAENVEDRVSGRRSIDESSDDHASALVGMLDFPELHRSRYSVFWAGMDVGLTKDPSEILVFAEYVPSAAEKRENVKNGIAVPLDGMTRLKLVTRINLLRIPDPLQVEAILWIIDFYRPRAFALDRTGLGLPMLQNLQKRARTSRLMMVEGNYLDDAEQTPEAETKVSEARKALTVIKGYNFSEKIVVEIDEELAAKLPPNLTPAEIVDKAGIKRNAKDAATDRLRELVDTQRFYLPWDKELINQWNGQTWQYDQSPIDAYGRRRATYSEGAFHALDAGRMAALGMFQQAIETMLAAPPKKKRPVLAGFIR